MTLLVFLPASARTWIIATHLLFHSTGLLLHFVTLIRLGTGQAVFGPAALRRGQTDLEEHTDGIFLDAVDHLLEHLIRFKRYSEGIPLGVSPQPNSFPQVIHGTKWFIHF